MTDSQLEQLRALRARLEHTVPYPWEAMESWIASARPLFRTGLREHLKDFEEFSETPSWSVSVRVVSGGSRWTGGRPRDNIAEAAAEDARANGEQAAAAKARLLAWIDGLLALQVAPEPAHPMDPVDRVRGILARLPAAIRTLSIRRTGRPPLTIDDEYDLQYLLHALLVVDFRDVRPEEWTPSYAGSASRMDFLLKPERVVVETKFVREDHDDRKITNELLIDRERYRAHQDCQTLVCYVYDPFRRLRNPEAIQNDLRSESNPKTVVVVYPV